MNDKVNIMKNNQPHTLPPAVINTFFIIGLLSALAIRSLIVLANIKPEWFRPVWYAGVFGYILFFSYRYFISQKRKKTIKQYDLISKIKAKKTLSDPEREATVYLLSSIEKSRENANYLFIFATSILAIATDIFLKMQ